MKIKIENYQTICLENYNNFRIMKKILTMIFVLFLFSPTKADTVFSNSKSHLYKMIDSGLTGAKINWGPEKKLPKIKVELPKNSPILISDYHSIWGASGGRRTWEGKNVKHHGVDFYVKPGDPIIAAGNGRVLLTMSDECSGPMIVIKHRNLYAYYIHLGKIIVKKGDKVKRGQKIAEGGQIINTKCGGGIEHIHFQISLMGPCKDCWGTWVVWGDPQKVRNPHKYWTGGKGKPECFIEGKKYKKSKLTIPVRCKSIE
tara:strand:+ start:1242 stop:2015 length:774 start_codon:yes stop_codon:yes gene_type:complete